MDDTPDTGVPARPVKPGLHLSARECAWLLGCVRVTQRVLDETRTTPAVAAIPERDVFEDAGGAGPADSDELDALVDLLNAEHAAWPGIGVNLTEAEAAVVLAAARLAFADGDLFDRLVRRTGFGDRAMQRLRDKVIAATEDDDYDD